MWTLEDGVLVTLHLEKADRARWVHVKRADDHVDETLDPAQLAAFASVLAHRTSDQEAAPYRTRHLRRGRGRRDTRADRAGSGGGEGARLIYL